MTMERKENIDNFFRDKLYDYEVPAPMDVWKRINGQMEQKRAKTRWIVISSMAASFAILISLSIGYYIGINHRINPVKNEVTSNPVVRNSQIKSISGTVDANNSSKNALSSASNEARNYRKSETSQKENNIIQTNNYNNSGLLYSANATLKKENKLESHSQVTFAAVQSIKAKLLNIKNLNHIILPVNYINEYLVSETYYVDKYEPETEKQQNHSWMVGGSGAPLYSYRNIQSNNSSYSTEYLNNVEKPILAYAGGIKVNYEINRWSFESGIYYSQIGQNITNPNTTQIITVIGNSGGDEYISINYRNNNKISTGDNSRNEDIRGTTPSSNYFTVSEDYNVVNSNGITNSDKSYENIKNNKNTDQMYDVTDPLIVSKTANTGKTNTVEY